MKRQTLLLGLLFALLLLGWPIKAAAVATMRCNYINYFDESVIDMELPMHGAHEFAGWAIYSIDGKEGGPFRETLLLREPAENEFYGFLIGKENPDTAMVLSIYHEEVGKAPNGMPKLASDLYPYKNPEQIVSGSCYVDYDD